MSKIHIICSRHDENLISLHQEAHYLGHNVIPFYIDKFNHQNLNKLYTQVHNDDYVMILHTNFGSELLYQIISRINCKKFLNSIPLSVSTIGDKFFQQQQVYKTNPTLTIDTYNKSNAIRSLSLPFIGKPSDGSCGRGVLLVESKEQIDELPNNYIFQPFIKNDGDWRVIVVGGKSISAIKRIGRVGQITNNLATGNFAVTEKNPLILENIYHVAEMAAKSMNFDYVGIDVIKNLENNKYHFLESNERPTFETSQILTGINIAQKIILELTK